MRHPSSQVTSAITAQRWQWGSSMATTSGWSQQPATRELLAIIRPHFWVSERDRMPKEINLSGKHNFCERCMKLLGVERDGLTQPYVSLLRSVSWEPNFNPLCDCQPWRFVNLFEIRDNPALFADFISKWQDRLGIPIEVWIHG